MPLPVAFVPMAITLLAKSNSESRQSKSNAKIAKYQARAEMHRISQEISLENKKVEATRAIALERSRNETAIKKLEQQLALQNQINQREMEFAHALLDTCRHVYDRKTDALAMSFQAVMDILKSHQASLKDEFRTVSEQRRENGGQNTLVDSDCSKRMSEIQASLNEIDRNAMLLQSQFSRNILALDLSVAKKQKMIEGLKFNG